MTTFAFTIVAASATLAACSGSGPSSPSSDVPLAVATATLPFADRARQGLVVIPDIVRIAPGVRANALVEEAGTNARISSDSLGRKCGSGARAIVKWKPKDGRGPDLVVHLTAVHLGRCEIVFRNGRDRAARLFVIVATPSPSPSPSASPSPTASPSVGFHPLADPNAFPFYEYNGDDPTGFVLDGIAPGPDGAMWFTEEAKIGRIDMTGAVSEWPIPSASSVPGGIVAGSDGAMWFTEQAKPAIGRIATSGQITEYPLPAGTEPLYIASGPDGALWATDFAGTIDRITTAGVLTAQYRIPTRNSRPATIVAGPDGNLWFAERAGKVAKITTAGAITEYRVPPPDHGASPAPAPFQPYALVVGPDRNIWFSGYDPSQEFRIGYVATNGKFKTWLQNQTVVPSYGIAAGDREDVFASLYEGAVISVSTSGAWTNLGSSVAYQGRTTALGTMARGPDGAFWFTAEALSSAADSIALIGRLAPNAPDVVGTGKSGVR
jgi:streptogramin lyase